MERTIVTVDTAGEETRPDIEALLIEGPHIAAVGRLADLPSEGVEIRHHSAGVVIPGLRDAHLHPVGYAAALQRPSLKNARDFSEIAEIVAAAAASQDPGSAITALRLDDESLAELRLPDRHLPDRRRARRYMPRSASKERHQKP